jgi:pyrroloquinoline quinone biosynthesis protein E
VSDPAPPLALIAELTHRCPLSCGYCSNPLELERAGAELPTPDWIRVLDEAAAMGVLHVHFTGGEPMARRDLATLVGAASRAGLYINLITSGVTLGDDALARLVEAGIDHIQLSFQDAVAASADDIGGYRGGHERKLAAAARIVAAGLPLTANFVVHRGNLDRVDQMLALGADLGASRIEIAHVQYHGWALLNRAALMPTLAQFERATAEVEAARARLKGRVVIDYVAPDYFATRPKACMGGWGRRILNVSPNGLAMPCHAAASLPGVGLPSVVELSLAEIWQDAEIFQLYRAPAFAPESCRGCDRLEIDWGGCRCQAFALTGDAARADPVCALSPDHGLIAGAIAQAGGGPVIPRRMAGAETNSILTPEPIGPYPA